MGTRIGVDQAMVIQLGVLPPPSWMVLAHLVTGLGLYPRMLQPKVLRVLSEVTMLQVDNRIEELLPRRSVFAT